MMLEQAKYGLPQPNPEKSRKIMRGNSMIRTLGSVPDYPFWGEKWPETRIYLNTQTVG